MGLIEFVKQAIAPQPAAPAPAADTSSAAASSAANAAATAAQTAKTTPVEDSASVFSTTASNTDNTNYASTTVILSDDYGEKETNAYNKKVWISANGQSIEKLTNVAYGTNTYDKMTEGEKSSAASAILDNNRWMIDNVNETYLATQVAQEVSSALYGNDSENFDSDKVLDYVEKILANPEKYDVTAYQNGMLEADEEKLADIATKVLKTQNGESGGFKQYDKDSVRTEQIPLELIAATDFTQAANGEDVKTIFVPDLSTLKEKSEKSDDSSYSFTREVNSKEDSLKLSLSDEAKAEYEKLESDADKQAYIKDYVQNAIAQN